MPSLLLRNRYGDSLRSGWRNVLDCVLRLHRLGLLPPGVVLLEAGDPDAGKFALPRAPASRRSASATSIISRAFSRCAAGTSFYMPVPLLRHSASATSIISRAFSRCAAVSGFLALCSHDHGT